MKKKLLTPLLLLAVISTTACGGDDKESFIPEPPETSVQPDNENTASMKMNITVDNNTITATMEDNAAARDLFSRLPMEVTLEDFNNTTEKIFYPNPALNIESIKRGCAPSPGDITIYAPWGNVAIFCKSWSHSNDLIKIGHIDGEGIETLNVAGNITVKLECQ